MPFCEGIPFDINNGHEVRTHDPLINPPEKLNMEKSMDMSFLSHTL